MCQDLHITSDGVVFVFSNHLETWPLGIGHVRICTLPATALSLSLSLAHLETWAPRGVSICTAPVTMSTMASWLGVSEHSGHGLYLRCLVVVSIVIKKMFFFLKEVEGDSADKLLVLIRQSVLKLLELIRKTILTL